MGKYEHYNGVDSRHANTCIIKVEGQIVAEGTSLSISEDPGTDGTYTVGTLFAHEHVHNRYTANGNIARVVFKKGALLKYGLGQTSIVRLPVFTVEAVDEIDGKTLFTATKCTLSGRDLSINANSRLAANLRFLSIEILDDKGKSAETA